MKFFKRNITVTVLPLTLAVLVLSAGCNIVKKQSKTAVVLKTEDAAQADLMREVDRFATVDSLRAKVDLKFEDNSYGPVGLKEAYQNAPGEIVVQRPGMILLKVTSPIVGGDIVRMTSDGEKFRVAILYGGDGGKYKKFLKGTNSADYSRLQRSLSAEELKAAKDAKQNVTAFANLRPQHFTDAMLLRPTDANDLYTMSTISQEETDKRLDSHSPIRTVLRGYYLLDEFRQGKSGWVISRRFWFDRVGGIRLARQQLFDPKGEIESDIVYGKEGRLANTDQYANLPLEILVTRPKERYAMRVTYQSPDAVTIGTHFPDTAFLLQNSWNLEEVDLDQKLRDAIASPTPTSANSNAAAHKFH